MLDWIATARHPATKRRRTEMVYQPMLEVLAYLRGNGFTTYIVSGGGIEFMRPWAERVYGIPPEQVIGSSGTRFELRNGLPVPVRLPELDFVDDKEGSDRGTDVTGQLTGLAWDAPMVIGTCTWVSPAATQAPTRTRCAIVRVPNRT